MVQIPEYNERIIANPEARSSVNIKQPSEFSDVSYLNRINTNLSQAEREQAKVMFDMKKDRDQGIVNEFLNQYSMARTEKLNELKEKYKGANAQGIMDEFKRWQEDYYTSHVGYSDSARDGALYLENKEQMKGARDALLKSAPSDINSLSLYAASELESYKKNQFNARVEMEAMDLAGETDADNIANKIAMLSENIDDFYGDQSPEFKAYTKRKLIDQAMTTNIANVIGSIDSTDSANMAYKYLDSISKFMSGSIYNDAKNKIDAKYAAELGKNRALKGSKGSGSKGGNFTTRAQAEGKSAAYIETPEEASEHKEEMDKLKEGKTLPEQRQIDAIERKAYLNERNEKETQGRKDIAAISDVFKKSVVDGESPADASMINALPPEQQEQLKEWGNSYASEAEIEDYKQKQAEDLMKTSKENAVIKSNIASAAEFASKDFFQDRVSQAVYQEELKEEQKNPIVLFGSPEEKQITGNERSFWSYLHDANMEMNPLYASAYTAGGFVARGTAWVKGLFDEGKVVQHTKEYQEDIDNFYWLKAGTAKSPKEYLEVANKIKNPELRNEALMMDALESKKRVILRNTDINSTIENVYKGIVRSSSKDGDVDPLLDEFKDYVAENIAKNENENGVQNIGVNEMEQYVRNLANPFIDAISKNNTPASAVRNIFLNAPTKKAGGDDNLLQTKRKYVAEKAKSVAKEYLLDANQTIIFTQLLLSNNIRAAKTMLEVRRKNGFR